MHIPHAVKRRPPEVAKLEDSDESREAVKDWILSHGDSVIWSGPRMKIVFGEGSRTELEIPVDFYIVYEDGYYLYCSDYDFDRKYVDHETVATEHRSAEESNIFYPRDVQIKAKQYPRPLPSEAAKDYEERVRGFARYLDEEKIDISDFGITSITYIYAGVNFTVYPGDWVIRNSRQEVVSLEDKDFRAFYQVRKLT